ncbi:4Fe-4S ferredoxin N-terminal domain-containing protein [Halostagnicola kamekurae]|uniref:Prokaryotic molybdopterin-containing oxidoreductase family, iron-sulfur binding subunit n=1 Tax=Halostagnicola kamekurae TaxID=619731 RepID=A0A1I6UGC5_9EURY|nr:4Fe-4S ferredoxin N-terminal domain-containing protein [Halostagnicola kamekurae]SFT00473.1 prokaryotic molybdopterin-containing oxidoreductase family, iron-sulfur binding subunit [Halostagnicola kamekurae]
MNADDESNGTDDSFHPLGEEWERELEESLEETEYDVELGMEMARDAMAVTKGTLSEAEFHERYHEDVMEEFGQDDRPTEAALAEMESGDEDSGGLAKALEAFDGDGDVDRREVIKKMGAGAAFLGLGAWSTADDPEPSVDAGTQGGGDDEGLQWGMALDLETCDGCLSCVEACADENQLDSGVNWMYVLDWEDPNEQLETGAQRLIRPCQHCTDAPCEKVCPTTARHTRQSDGLVLTDYAICIGCRYCQVACPYGVNYFQWMEPEVPEDAIDDQHIYDERDRPVDSRAPRGVMSKCTFCPTRQDGHEGEEMVGSTACEDACPPEAIQFGDMNDPESPPRQYLDNPALARARAVAADDDDDIQEAIDIVDGETEPAEEGDDGMTEAEAQALIEDFGGEADSTFKLLEEMGTNPNIIYIGNEPGANAQQVEGPIQYDELSYLSNDDDTIRLADARKNVTEEGTVGGDLL